MRIIVTKEVISIQYGLVCKPGDTGTVIEHNYGGWKDFRLVEFDNPGPCNDFPLLTDEYIIVPENEDG